MPEMCPRCGLPKELCVCEILDREATKRIKIYKARAKFSKFVTIVEGLSGDELDKTTVALKNKLACGGTHKKGMIELQGDHIASAKKELVNLGFPEGSIDAAI
jgi:translation initiation factor 1